MTIERKTAQERMLSLRERMLGLRATIPNHPETWHVDRADAIRIAEDYAAQEVERAIADPYRVQWNEHEQKPCGTCGALKFPSLRCAGCGRGNIDAPCGLSLERVNATRAAIARLAARVWSTERDAREHAADAARFRAHVGRGQALVRYGVFVDDDTLSADYAVSIGPAHAGPWVKHEEARAIIDAQDAEIERLRGLLDGEATDGQ